MYRLAVEAAGQIGGWSIRQRRRGQGLATDLSDTRVIRASRYTIRLLVPLSAEYR